jgi:hypothetical protein
MLDSFVHPVLGTSTRRQRNNQGEEKRCDQE